MIKPFGDLLIRFRKDERGVFLVFFALIAVVLIAASGAVVDFTRVQQARTRAQIALDAAALALQGTISNSGVTAATLKTKAQALLTERIADSSVTAVVEDNGVGFEPGARADGLGVVGMRERAALVGGRLVIESAKGAGTTLVAEVPAP